MEVDFFASAGGLKGGSIVKIVEERYHAGYVSPDKALGQECCTRIAVVLTYELCARLRGVFAGVAQLVEHLICNQRVGGSSPFASSR